MPPFRRASAFLCYIWKKNNPSVFRRKKFRLPCPSNSYASLILQIPNFREKIENIFSRAIAFDRYPFPAGSYILEILKSKNFGIPLQIFSRNLLPSDSYVLEMEETDIFRCFHRKLFSHLVTKEKSKSCSLISFLWTTSTQNHGRICRFVPLLTAMYLKEEKIPISSCFSEKSSKFSEALCHLRNPILLVAM